MTTKMFISQDWFEIKYLYQAQKYIYVKNKNSSIMLYKKKKMCTNKQ